MVGLAANARSPPYYGDTDIIPTLRAAAQQAGAVGEGRHALHRPSPFVATAHSVTAHSPTGRSALVEVGEAVRTGVALFARVSGFAACSAGAVALVVVTSEGGGDRRKCKSHNQNRSDCKHVRVDLFPWSRVRPNCSRARKPNNFLLCVSNLQLRGKKLEFSIRSPLDLIINRIGYSIWLGD